MKKILMVLLFTVLALMVNITNNSTACTRIVYQSKSGNTYTARTMDWDGDMKTNLWIFPRGMQRDGSAGENPFMWTSKYGSVISTAYDFATCDGVNEKGLSVNLLWLSSSKFPNKDGVSKTMSLAIFPQYLLDSYATVKDAVAGLEKNEFIVLTDALPGESNPAGIHLSLSDSSGDNAILEFINGKLVIYHGKQYNVLTNDPTFDKQLANKENWEKKGSQKNVPGSYGSSDRFIRVFCYAGLLPEVNSQLHSLSSVIALIRGISVPNNERGFPPTIWRTVIDHKNLVYHFESAENPYNMFWVDLKNVDFSEKASVKVLKIAGGNHYYGDATSDFAAGRSFAFFEIE